MSEPNGNQFKGTIKLDIRDSKPDWDAFLYQKILECRGIEMPETIDGIKQSPLAGVSMRQRRRREKRVSGPTVATP